ncbi:MAG: hypothetical protein ABJA62_05225 [Luteimonas sp.]
MIGPNVFLPPLLLVALLAGCQREATPNDAKTATANAPDSPVSADPGVQTAATRIAEQGDGTITSGSPPSTIPVPSLDTPTPPIAAGAQITYTCEDGSELIVTYSGVSAEFALSNGSKVTLPRVASTVKTGGDVYVNDSAALQRLSNVVRVEEHDGAKRVCSETSGTA